MKDFMNVRLPSSSRLPRAHLPKDLLVCILIFLFSVQMYSNLVQRCFNDCVNDFTSKSLLSKEEGCVMRCVDKFLKSSERLGERFQEQNAAMAQQGSMSLGR
jgi:mitochondrial import inner membrane translocase subunit TIM9